MSADDIHPNPTVWPACDNCQMAYILRRCYSLSKGWGWFWQQDCQRNTRGNFVPGCKGAGAHVVEAEAEVAG